LHKERIRAKVRGVVEDEAENYALKERREKIM
jgi:hypothetical protein